MYCARGHSFDVARSGYINLLQPQDRKSKYPGDTAAALEGRRQLHERGFTAPLVRAIAGIAGTSQRDVALDAGCGDGLYLGTLTRETGFNAHGVDISVPAIQSAAKRYPECQWVVANADRFLPYADGCFDLVLSITARMNSGEFRRVLRANGRLLVAVAAPDDLIELRGRGRDRVARTVQTFAGEFRLVRQERATAKAQLDAAGVRNLLHAIYRPMQARPPQAGEVTLSMDLLLFHAA